jgi:hypothetical protein
MRVVWENKVRVEYESAPGAGDVRDRVQRRDGQQRADFGAARLTAGGHSILPRAAPLSAGRATVTSIQRWSEF